MAELVLESVSKHFGDMPAVDAVDLRVRDGEFLALLGPSGCGKTTILRLVAGFEEVSAGRVLFDDRVVSDAQTHVPPERRRVGIVFQSYALWPHMSVAGNVGYPLKVAGVRGDALKQRVAAALDVVGLTGFAERRPADMSGGQRQRVALARCLVMEPTLMLFDEPLANLDVHLRAAMEAEFVDFHRKTGTTIVYITHDQAEAMAMADRIAVMDAGRIVQLAAPETLYAEPATAMVADFIGQGVVVDGEVEGAGEAGCARIALFGQSSVVRCADGQPSGPARVSLRPEGLRLTDDGGFAATIERTTYKGGTYAVEARPHVAPEMPVRLSLARSPAAGAEVRIAIDDAWVIPG